MYNKYLYAFLKDSTFRVVCILSVIAVVFCLVLFRLNLWQNIAFKDIQNKQAIIARIPALEAQIVNSKVLVNKGIRLTLNGIISNNTQYMAIINNTLLKFGEVIEGQRLVTITHNSATLCDILSDNRCITLYLEK